MLDSLGIDCASLRLLIDDVKSSSEMLLTLVFFEMLLLDLCKRSLEVSRSADDSLLSELFSSMT